MKVLFFGLGGIGQRHLRNLVALVGEELDVHAFRQRRNDDVVSERLDSITGESLESKYSITVHDSIDAALAVEPDLVMVCNPSNLHVVVVAAAVSAGLPVFVEKPVGSDWVGVPELIAEVDAMHVPVFVGYQLRFHPCVQKAFELVRGGAIGRIVAIQMSIGEYLPNWHRYEDYRQMYAARSELGGGVVLSQIHEFDLLIDLLGSPVSVTAMGGHLSDLEIDVEDTVTSLFGFDVGGRQIPVSVHQDFLQQPTRREYRFVGSAGKVEVDLVRNTVESFDDTGSLIDRMEIADFERNDLFVGQIEDVLAGLDGQKHVVPSIREGAESLRMALAVLRSMSEHRTVAIGEFEL